MGHFVLYLTHIFDLSLDTIVSLQATRAAKIGPGGRIVIPAAMRKALGVDMGDTVILKEENGELRITSLDQTIRHIQNVVRQYVPENVSLVDELIAERRAEAERE